MVSICVVHLYLTFVSNKCTPLVPCHARVASLDKGYIAEREIEGLEGGDDGWLEANVAKVAAEPKEDDAGIIDDDAIELIVGESAIPGPCQCSIIIYRVYVYFRL